MGVYDYKVAAQDGKEVALEDYKGKVLLIVNTATECGFTPQYDDLEAIYKDFKDDGLEILDFPCNQFAGQAPGSDEEINQFCQVKFGTEFPRFKKIEVNGENADPLFKYLTENTSFEGFESKMGLALKPIVKKMDKDYKNNGNIKWNFTKFLIGRDGEILERFEPTKPMDQVREAVQKAL
jgi:glutathione peroxidase